MSTAGKQAKKVDHSHTLLQLADIAEWWDHLHDERMHGTGVAYQMQGRTRPIDDKSTPEAIGPSPAPVRTEILDAIAGITTDLLKLEDSLRAHLAQELSEPRPDRRDTQRWAPSSAHPLDEWQPAAWSIDALADARARVHVDPRVPEAIAWLTNAIPTVTDPAMLSQVRRDIGACWRSTRLHTGVAEHIIPMTGHRCPHCKTLGLVAFMDQGFIRCTFGGCRCTEATCPCHNPERDRSKPAHSWRHDDNEFHDEWRRLAQAIKHADERTSA